MNGQKKHNDDYPRRLQGMTNVLRSLHTGSILIGKTKSLLWAALLRKCLRMCPTKGQGDALHVQVLVFLYGTAFSTLLANPCHCAYFSSRNWMLNLRLFTKYPYHKRHQELRYHKCSNWNYDILGTNHISDKISFWSKQLRLSAKSRWQLCHLVALLHFFRFCRCLPWLSFTF